jgi:hypothetical protein
MGRKDNLAAVTKTVSTSWDKFADYLMRVPPETDDKATVGWYCGAQFEPAYRDSKNFVARHLLTFDYDVIEPADLGAIQSSYKGYEFVMYTTWSHTVEKPRVRVVFPLSRPATMDEFCAVTRKVAALFDIEKLARESNVPSQIMFLPAKRPGGIFKAKRNSGEWADVDKILGEYEDWRDRSQWPKHSVGDTTHTSGDELVAPDEKPGIVGDFCRTFRIPEAIERFDLPYVRGTSDDRFTYTKGTRADGARLYDDGLKLHSENNTDPAHGQNNAFDLVRLHLFGTLDSADDQKLGVTQRPSFKAMVELALAQPEVESARLSEEFENLDDTADDAPSSGGESAADKSTQRDTSAPPAPSHLALPLEDLIGNPTKPRWLLRDRLEQNVIALLVGSRGAYKSFIAIDWLMEVAKNHGPVYVLSAEGLDFDRRAKAWLLERAPEWNYENRVFVAQRRIDLSQRDNIELIRADCLQWQIRPKLFVLDTFSKLSGAMDENSNSDVKSFIGQLDNGLKRAFDATVLLVAHTGHSEKMRARGASALEADTDAVYIVTKHEDYVTLTRERFKSSPELEPLALRPKIIPLGYNDDDGMAVTSVVLEEIAMPKTPGQRPEPRGLFAQNALATAREVLKGGKTMHVGQLTDIALGRMPAPENGARDTRRQQLVRGFQKLVAEGWLHLHKDNMLGLTSAIASDDNEWES